MLFEPLFLCIGFMLAVLYMDLVFDLSALPHRHVKGPLPNDILDPIAMYYRYITRNPYLLMFVMLTTTVCIVAEIYYRQVPRWAGYTSLALIAIAQAGGVLKVIPTAQRLGAGKDTVEEQTRMVRSIFPAHLVLLVCILLLAAVQLVSTFK